MKTSKLIRYVLLGRNLGREIYVQEVSFLLVIIETDNDDTDFGACCARRPFYWRVAQDLLKPHLGLIFIYTLGDKQKLRQDICLGCNV